MNRILELLIAMAIVVVIAVVVGLLLPSHQHVSHSTETNRPLPVVFDMLSGFKRFKDWSAVRTEDPKAEIKVQASPEHGKGARVDYVSANPRVGSGSWQVDEVVDGEKIVYKIQNGDYGDNKTMTFRFKRTGNQLLSVEITESYDVDYGWNLFGRYAGLYVSRSVGDRMKSSLANLNTLLATVPKFDYTQLTSPPKVVDVPAENLLVVDTKSKRTDKEIQSWMQTQERLLRQVIEHNGLEASGPIRIVTVNFGADEYEFQVALPVRKTGEAAPAAGVAPPQLSIKPEGGVQYVQTKPVRAVTTTYTGEMAALPADRDSMKAWAITHGEDVGDHPYEIYNKGVDAAFTNDGDFTLYWPLKPQSGK